MKQIKTHPAKPGLGPRAAHGAHHFRSAAPGGDEFGDEFGRVLEVGVHRHNRVAVGGAREPGGEGALETEIA